MWHLLHIVYLLFACSRSKSVGSVCCRFVPQLVVQIHNKSNRRSFTTLLSPAAKCVLMNLALYKLITYLLSYIFPHFGHYSFTC